MPRIEKVAISLPKVLLDRVDREATRRAVSRSAVIREALEEVFNDLGADPEVAKAARIYAQIAEDDRRLNEAFLRVAAPLPPYVHGRPRKGKR